MDYAACNVVYVDRTAPEDQLVRRDDVSLAPLLVDQPNHLHGHAPTLRAGVLSTNLQTLLGTFSEVHVCKSGNSCISKLSELNQASIAEMIPTIVLIDIPNEDRLSVSSQQPRTPSPGSRLQVDGYFEEPTDNGAYGLGLLRWIASEIQYQSLSKLIVPIALVPGQDSNASPLTSAPRGRTSSRTDGSLLTFNSFITTPKKGAGLVIPLDQSRTMTYLDVGAVDVLTSPLLQERLPSLGIHAYRAHKDASKDQRAILDMKRGRKRSWVGLDDQKPYAYLREAMVSGLMDGICKLGGPDEEPLVHVRITVSLDRQDQIAKSVGEWNFSAHDFTDDELLHAALIMLQHALSMPELEKWRISTDNLTGFLVASRSAYNAFVPYHNFRHVVDVLQAIFYFLVQIGRLPPYPASSSPFHQSESSPIAALIRPFDAFTLLITAIGHDVGHPGVNNAFLVTLSAPLAQLYNDRSVLESFHCAAYSQILRRHWPAAFSAPDMRQLMINSILATDMGLHFDYMKKLGFLQEKLHENGGTDGWNGRLLEEQRTLACSLLIKCADISNVARKYEVAAQWTMILTDEFARQAAMEKDLGIPSALFAAPVRETIELGKSQIGFMNMFAIPLFQGVTDVMPGMEFCVEELQQNKSLWEKKIADEQERVRRESVDVRAMDGMFSPRSMSIATPSDASYQRKSSTTLPNPGTISESSLRAAFLNKSPFAPSNGVLDESSEPIQNDSAPESSTPPAVPAKDSPQTLGTEESNSSPKPSQLQLSYATASAPGLVDHPSEDKALANGIHGANGVDVQPSLVTDPVVVEPSDAPEEVRKSHPTSEKQRSSDTTEASASAAGDWTSQATRSTTTKMPISPSTKGTSVTSRTSFEKSHAQNGNQSAPAFGSSFACKASDTSTTTSSAAGTNDTNEIPSSEFKTPEKVTPFMDTVRSLKKKPSRFRMNSLNFWKRSKSASPPMPAGDHGLVGLAGIEDERRSRGSQYS